MSAAERRAAEDTAVPGLVPRDRPPPDEAEWWREKANGGSTFFNVGEATWQASREQYRTQGRRKSRPAPPPPVYYDSIHSGLMSPRRTYDLPGRMTSLSFSTTLISKLPQLPEPSVTTSTAGTLRRGRESSCPGGHVQTSTSNSGTGGV